MLGSQPATCYKFQEAGFWGGNGVKSLLSSWLLPYFWCLVINFLCEQEICSLTGSNSINVMPSWALKGQRCTCIKHSVKPLWHAMRAMSLCSSYPGLRYMSNMANNCQMNSSQLLWEFSGERKGIAPKAGVFIKSLRPLSWSWRKT